MTWADGDLLSPTNLNTKRPSWSTTFPFYDARQFGATGDGVTDDWASIQSAVSTAAALGNPTNKVFLAPGNYLVSRPIVLYEKTGLFGVGPRGTTIKAHSTFTGVALISCYTGGQPSAPQQHAYLEGLELQGGSAAGVNGVYWDGVGQISYIRDVEINNITGYGIKILSTGSVPAIGVLLENISITSTGNHCVILGPRARGNIIRNLAGQTMPPGFAAVSIDGTLDDTFGQTASNFLYEVHHESTAHSSYGVSITSSTDNVITNTHTARANSTDTLIYLGQSSYRNVIVTARPGGSNNFTAIQDVMSGTTIVRSIVPMYMQSDSTAGGQAGGDSWFGHAYFTQGSVSSPAMSFTSEPNLGWYKSAASTMALSTGTLTAPIVVIGTDPGGTGTLRVAGESNVSTNMRAYNGNVVVGLNGRAAQATVVLNTAAGQHRDLQFKSAGSDRWDVRVNNTAEGGSNTGSNFQLQAFDDTGTLIDTPLTIGRAVTSAVSFSRPISVVTTGTSFTSLTVGAGQLAFFVGGSSGASIGIRSGSTLYWFSSSASTVG